MYKYNEENYISNHQALQESTGLCTTHFSEKIKPGPGSILLYYYSARTFILMFYICFLTWLKYDQFMTIGLIHRDL